MLRDKARDLRDRAQKESKSVVPNMMRAKRIVGDAAELIFSMAISIESLQQEIETLKGKK